MTDLQTAHHRQRYAQARDSGEQARRNGLPQGANPYRGSTRLVRDLRDEWDRGWIIADQLVKGAR